MITVNTGNIQSLQPEHAVLAQESGEFWQLYHGDCCEVIRGFPDNSIDLWCYSLPFAGLYIYSDSVADLGNCDSDEEFFQHYEFLVAELFRVTVPGRLCVVHCKDLPRYKNRDGAAGLSDFPGKIIAAHERHGWQFHSRITIWKCPVTEMQRTKSYGLLHKQLCKDSTASRQGMADYLVVFRKWGDGLDEFPKPVHGPSEDVRFTEYAGTQPPGTPIHAVGGDDEMLKVVGPPETPRDYSIQVWQRYASPVWFDINQMDVLNYQLGKDKNDEKHICPLQKGVVERVVRLWSNPGDVVGTPFAGIGTEVAIPVELGRRAVGMELKESYFKIGCQNARLAEQERKTKKLFE